MKLAVIPARGGSKRIPRKNIRPFLGKPIISYSIAAARASGLFDHIVVSTDDEQIAAIARACGAETPFMRPESLSDDYTGTNAVVKHAVQWYRYHDTEPSLVCCIYATAPFVDAKYLIEGHDLLLASDREFAFSVTRFRFPLERALRITTDKSIKPVWPEHVFTRSQDLEPAFHDAGQFYWGRARAFLEDKLLYSNVSVPVVLPQHLVQDIDDEEDWLAAEYMYQSTALRGNSQ